MTADRLMYSCIMYSCIISVFPASSAEDNPNPPSTVTDSQTQSQVTGHRSQVTVIVSGHWSRIQVRRSIAPSAVVLWF